ncbi:hypothetical protein DVA67_025800 [Solirubrobacter sp. CPCC 204708]|nr:hypothetical protein [Solirubrobacter deserti]
MRRIACLAGALMAFGGGTAMAADITYTGASGAWTTAANWDLGRVPAPGDTVRIPTGKQVTLDTAASVARLELAGAVLGTGDLTVGSGTWTGGFMGGSGTTRVTGTFTHSKNVALNDTRVLAIEGTLELAEGGTYINRGTNATPLIRNTGTIKRTATTGVVELFAPVENDGVIDGVELEGGGSGSTGQFIGADFHGGTHELADGAKLVNTTISGGAVDVTGTVTATGAQTGGTLGGSGTFHITGPFAWSGGVMGGAGTTRVTGTVTHTKNAALHDTRVLAIEGTLELAGANQYINRGTSATPLIRNTGTIKRTAATGVVQLFPAVENDGVIRDVELEGGGSGSTGEFAGATLHSGTFELETGAKLTAVTLNGATVNTAGTVTGSGPTTLSGGTLGGTGTFVFGGAFTWSGGQMTGAGTTRVTGALTHTAANTALSAGRVLAVEGTLDSTRAINGTGGAAIRVTGTYKGTGTTTAAVDNDGLVQGVELGGGGTGVSTGVFSGAALKAGTFELDAELAGNTVVSGATVNGAVELVAARLTGGTVGAAADVTGTLEWTGGKMAGPGTTRVTQGATLILNGISSLATGRVLENRGLIDVRGSASLFDDFDQPAERVDNHGTIRKTAGTSSTLGAPLRNAGTVDGAVGELVLEDGTSEPDTGTFTGARVVLGGARTLAGAATLPGTVELTADLTVRAGDTLAIDGTLLHRAGRLRGDVLVNGRVRVDGGRQSGPGTTTIAAAGQLVVTPLRTFGCGSGSMDAGRVLVNHGLVRLEKGGQLGVADGVRITNGGRIELDTPNDTSCGSAAGIHGDAVLLNTGTIAKTGGTSGSYLRVVVDNDGTINGPLELESAEGVTHTGTFKDVVLGDGVLVVDAGTALTGVTEVAGGELRVLAPVTLAGLRQTGGTIAGGGALTVTGTLTWSDGDQEGPGATVLAAGATGVVSDNVGLDEDRELRNAGTLTLDDATLFLASGASIRNAGVLALDGAAELQDSAFRYGFGEAGLVHNTGTLRKTGTGVALARASIDNDGVIEVLDGRLELPELLNWSGPLMGGAGTLAGGRYVVGNGAALLLPGALKTNAARVALGAGSQVLHYAFTGPQPVLTDGLGGLLRNAAGGVLELTGGRSLTVAGTFVNQGVLALGAGSTLSAGGYVQAAGAVLRPTLTPASAGRVAVTGTAQLGGRLDVVAPAAVGGDVAVVSGAVAGTFGAVTGEYVPTYAAGGVTVRRPGGEAPAAALAESPAAATFAPAAPALAPAPASAKAPAAKAVARKPAKPVKKAKKKTKKKKKRR